MIEPATKKLRRRNGIAWTPDRARDRHGLLAYARRSLFEPMEFGLSIGGKARTANLMPPRACASSLWTC